MWDWQVEGKEEGGVGRVGGGGGARECWKVGATLLYLIVRIFREWVEFQQCDFIPTKSRADSCTLAKNVRRGGPEKVLSS